MKHLGIFFILWAAMLPVLHAQRDTTLDRGLYPGKGDLGITVNVTGMISNISAAPRADLRGVNTLLLRYVINDQWTFRGGLAPYIFNYKENRTDSVGKDLVEFDSTARRADISFRPGMEYHFTGSRRLDPYAALDIEFGLVGRYHAASATNITDTTGTARFTRTVTEDGGISFGAKLSAGMNYYVSRKLFVGVEYGMGVSYLSSGGDRQEVYRSEPVSGSATTVRDLSSRRTNDLGFVVDPTVQITFGYYFSL